MLNPMIRFFSSMDDSDGDATDAPPTPSREAQREELRQILASLAGPPPTFQRGDPVRYKRRLGQMKDHLALIYWCPIDPSDPWDLALIASTDRADRTHLPDADCLIAHLGNTKMTFELGWSPFLEMDDGGEAAT